jgi:hypothetical protein
LLQNLFAAAIALAMAALVATAAYAALHAWRREPVPTAAAAPWPPPPAELPGLAELPAVVTPPLAAAAAFAGRSVPRTTAPVELTLRGNPPPGAGVGIVDGRSGALLAWQPLPSAAPAPPGSVAFAAIPEGMHWAVLAVDRAAARYAYFARTGIEVASHPAGSGSAANGAAARAELGAEVFGVVVELSWPRRPGAPQPILAWRLSREDDRDWSFRGYHGFVMEPAAAAAPPSSPAAAGDEATAHREAPALPAALPPDRPEDGQAHATLGLGRGRYRLELDGAVVEPEDQAKLAFDVPGASRVLLRCRIE